MIFVIWVNAFIQFRLNSLVTSTHLNWFIPTIPFCSQFQFWFEIWLGHLDLSVWIWPYGWCFSAVIFEKSFCKSVRNAFDHRISNLILFNKPVGDLWNFLTGFFGFVCLYLHWLNLPSHFFHLSENFLLEHFIWVLSHLNLFLVFDEFFLKFFLDSFILKVLRVRPNTHIFLSSYLGILGIFMSKFLVFLVQLLISPIQFFQMSFIFMKFFEEMQNLML